jgi:hypothetical protein
MVQIFFKKFFNNYFNKNLLYHCLKLYDMFKTLNTAGIAAKVKRNKKQKNLYQRVNNFLKGGNTASPELIDEIREIVLSEAKEFEKHCMLMRAKAKDLVN